MKRSIFIGIAVSLCLATLGFAGLLIYRTTVAQWFLTAELTARGFKFTDMEVTALGLGEAKISGITAGRDRELQVEEVTLTYRWPDLFAGQFAGVSVDGLTLALDLTGEGPPLGSLGEVFGPLLEESEAAGPPEVLPSVTVRDAKVVARTQIGPASFIADGLFGPVGAAGTPGAFTFAVLAEEGEISGRLDFTINEKSEVGGKLVLEPGRLSWSPVGLELAVAGGSIEFDAGLDALEQVTGKLALDALRLEGRDFGAGNLDLSLDRETFRLAGKYGAAQEASGIDLAIDVSGLTGEPRLAGSFTLGAVAGDFPWQIGDLPRPTSGRADLRIDLEGFLPGVEALRQAGEDPYALLRQAKLEAEMGLTFTDWALPEQASDFDARLPLSLRLEEGRVSAAVNAEAAGKDLAFLRSLLEAADLPPALLGASQSLALAGLAGETFEIETDLTQVPISIELRGGVTLDAPNHLRSKLAGEAKLKEREGNWILELGDLDLLASSPDLRDLPLGKVELGGKVSGSVSLTGATAEDSVEVSIESLKLEIEQDQGEPLPLVGSAGSLLIDAEEARFDSLALTLPSQRLRLEKIDANLPLEPSGQRKLNFTIGQIRDTEEPARFTPGRVEGRLDLAPERYLVEAQFQTDKAGQPLAITGSHVPQSGRGSIQLAPTTIAFREKGLQPADFSPRLADLKKTEGAANLQGRVSWGPNGTKGEIAFALDDFSTEAEGNRISGLRLGLRLDPLFPLPGSPPNQRLFIEDIQAAVPIEDLTADFQVLPQEPAAILIQRADFTALGSRLRVEDTIWLPEGDGQSVAVQVLGLDLGALLEKLNMEELKGSGDLVGQIPVRIEGERVIVTDAQLRAREPGLLQFKSEAAANLLSSGGEQVELLLQALEDFRYEDLSLTASKDGDDELTLKLRLLGRNPAVLEGRPFQFNINLDGNIGPILQALAEGTAVSSDALRRSWRLRQ